MLHGFHAVLARLRVAAGSIEHLYVDQSRHDARMRDLVKLAGERGVRVVAVDAARLAGLAKGDRHQGVVAEVREIERAASLEELLDGLEAPALLLVLDGVTDPHNLGACLRVADAAGVQAVIAPKDRAAGISPVVTKVASGAADTVPYFMVTNLARTLEELKARDIWTVGAADDAPQDLFEAEIPRAVAWVLGAEGTGLRRLTRERCDTLIRIPMFGAVESLNVSVAAGICLYETRRRGLPGPSRSL